MIKEIAQAVMQKFDASSVLKGQLSGGLYFQLAPQNATFPYGVFYFNGITIEEIMGSATNNITTAELQFNLFSNAADGGEEIAVLTDEFATAFDWQELFVAGWRYIKMQKENVLALGLVDSVWQSVINYSLGLQKE